MGHPVHEDTCFCVRKSHILNWTDLKVKTGKRRCASFLIFPIHFWHFSLSKMIRTKVGKIWPKSLTVKTLRVKMSICVIFFAHPIPIYGFYGRHYWHEPLIYQTEEHGFSLSKNICSCWKYSKISCGHPTQNLLLEKNGTNLPYF